MLLQLNSKEKGGENKAIPKTLFNGLAHYIIPELMKQRIRWCRRCFQTLKINKFFLTLDLSLKQIINNITIVIRWFNFFSRFVYLSLPLLVIF